MRGGEASQLGVCVQRVVAAQPRTAAVARQEAVDALQFQPWTRGGVRRQLCQQVVPHGKVQERFETVAFPALGQTVGQQERALWIAQEQTQNGNVGGDALPGGDLRGGFEIACPA